MSYARTLCLGALLVACQSPAESISPRFASAGGFIRDRSGRALILRGVNLSNAHKRPPYFGFHQRRDFLRLRDQWAFNGVRLLLQWAAIEPRRGEIDESYLDKVVERLRWARDAGLLVVLDMHQDVFGEGFGHNGAPRWACDESRYDAHVPAKQWFLNYSSPQVMACFDDLYTKPEIVARFAAAWRALAERVRAAGDLDETVVGFDPLNEPHWGSASVFTFEKQRLAPFYARVVAAVREVAPDWLAFIEPANSRNVGIATSLPKPSYVGVVYAPHSYDARAESGDGFDPTRTAAVRDNIAALAGEARQLGAALWIGEYGGDPTKPGIAEYMAANYDGAGAVAAGTMVWEYGRGDGGYALLDSGGHERGALVDALVRPYPARVAGTPLSYAFEPSTRRFELRYRPDGAIRAPTVIVVPWRLYPRGVVVTCDGCSSEHDPQTQRLHVVAPPRGDPARVVITPR